MRAYPLMLVGLLSWVSCTPDAGVAFHELLDEAWEFELREDPLFATQTGDRRYNDQLPVVTADAEARRADARRDLLIRLQAIDRDALVGEDRISHIMFARQLEETIADFEFHRYRFPLTVDNGFHISFARLPNQVPLATVADYENYIARLLAFPEYVSQHIGLLQEGIETGYTLPRVILDGYDVTVSTHVVEDPSTSLFYAPFASFPTTVPSAERARLREAGLGAIREAVVPGYQTFLNFLTNEYIPNARMTTGASDLENGRAYYEHLVRSFTTLDRTPEEIHEIGLSEVARIRAAMDSIIRVVGFRGSFASFLEYLRTDPRFYPTTGTEYLTRAAYIAKKMDGRLPLLFKTLPRQPYGIQPVPDHLAPKYTGGRYVGAPLGGFEPGYYWVNVYALESRPYYVLPALTLHEAVPGHHLQNALRKELTGLPNFRRYTGIGAYGEGWGLYSEYLGVEAGIYEDPYEDFGRLTYEMWRACRLVVDTGLHAFGWSRQRVLDYLASNTALSLHEVRTETDRYISWPGQALAYKMGELKIRELRDRAEQALQDRFDVREFHEVVLRHGPVPLGVLETLVDDYIAAAGREG